MTRADLRAKCLALAPAGDAQAKATLEALDELDGTRELLNLCVNAPFQLELAKGKIANLEDELKRLTHTGE